MSAAVLLVAHGTRDPAGVAETERLRDLVAERLPGRPARLAYVDVLGPTIAEATADLPGPVVVVPMFLAAGYHVRHDIPAAVGELGRPDVVVAGSLGPDTRLAGVLRERLAQAGARPDDLLVLAAAGSSDQRSLDDVAAAAGQVAAHAGREVRVGYVATAEPQVPDVVAAWRAERPGRRIAVASWWPEMSAATYPTGLRLAGRRVVVVGGGHLAERRLAALLDAAADVEVVAPRVTPYVADLADRDRVRWQAREYADGDLAGAWYALAVADSTRVNAAVADEAERRRVFCARADDASGSSAWTPAVGRHDGVAVSVVGDDAPDPARTVGIRDALLDDLRQGPPRRRRRRHRPGVCLVGAGPGDPGLITVRGRHALHEADVVVADRLVPRALLDELAADVEVVDAAKIPYTHGMAQAEINTILVERARSGRYVVRLKGGDPFVFGRGYEELLACAAAGIECTVVPGVSSASAVPAAAGVPVTHRGVAHEFVVVSAHVPPGSASSLVDWDALGRLRGTVVVLMGAERLSAVTTALISGGRDPATPALVVQDGTTTGQRSVRDRLDRIAAATRAAGVRQPAIVVVGPVVGAVVGTVVGTVADVVGGTAERQAT